jgi:hypothetical protein
MHVPLLPRQRADELYGEYGANYWETALMTALAACPSQVFAGGGVVSQ